MHWFDIIIAIIAIVALIKGYSSGFVTQVASLAGIILGAIFAGQLAGFIAPRLISIMGTNPHYMGPISYIISFLIILIALSLLGKVVNNILQTVHLGFFNRILGAIFCGIKYMIIASILLNLVDQFDQGKQIIKEDTRANARTYPLVKELTSKVIPFLRFDWVTSSQQQSV